MMFSLLLPPARRREIRFCLSLLFAAVMLLPLSAAVSPVAAQKSFVVAANGDPYETMWRKSLIPAFEKTTGMSVVWSAGLSAQNLAKIIQQIGQVQYAEEERRR